MSVTENNAAKWLGKQVRDMITGYEGICMGYVQYTSGCDNIGIKPTELKEDGSPKEMRYFDDMHCEVVNHTPKEARWFWDQAEAKSEPEPEPKPEQKEQPPIRPPGGPRENPPG